MQVVVFKTCDDETVSLNAVSVQCSNMVAGALYYHRIVGGPAVLHLPNITAHTLQHVLCWTQRHALDEELTAVDLLKMRSGADEIPQWDAHFLQAIGLEALFRLIVAARYLDIKRLTHYATKTVALMMKGKMPEQIRSLFELEDDVTRAENDSMQAEFEHTLRGRQFEGPIAAETEYIEYAPTGGSSDSEGVDQVATKAAAVPVEAKPEAAQAVTAKATALQAVAAQVMAPQMGPNESGAKRAAKRPARAKASTKNAKRRKK